MQVLVMIHNPDIGCVAIGPPEHHSPLVVDPDRVETFKVPAQIFANGSKAVPICAVSGASCETARHRTAAAVAEPSNTSRRFIR
jgi:hypothetical protein